MKQWLKKAWKPTVLAVVGFILLYIAGLLNDAEAGELDAVVGVGYGATHSSTLVVQELGLQYDERWGVSLTRTGNEARLPDTWVVKGERRVSWRENKDFEPYASFGVAWFVDKPSALVDENLTFSLAVGVRWREVVELGWQHYSTSGRSSPNKGIDYVILRAILELP